MTDIVERASEELDPDARMDAYYYSFDRTGLAVIDRILSEVADAGKAYHYTEEWMTDYDEPRWARHWEYGPTSACHADRIQHLANEGAKAVRELIAEIRQLRERLALADEQLEAIADVADSYRLIEDEQILQILHPRNDGD